ncbi:MAG: GC-type dockerin domain-anchored protein, partial [Planctomycetota bacterium]
VNGSAFYLFQVGFVGCNEFDLAEPAGVISQADVSEFINLFFANSPTVAAYAAPFDVVSQADVNAFVAGFFAGCPTN